MSGLTLQLLALLLLQGAAAVKLLSTNRLLVVEPGEKLTMPCVVNTTGWNIAFHMLRWVKLVGTREVEIASVANLKPMFHETRRYKTTISQPKEGMGIELQVQPLAPNDNGTYRCILNGRDNLIRHVQYDVVVVSPISELTLGTNANVTNGRLTTYNLMAGNPARISCRSRGGNPLPVMRIYRGREDVTALFRYSSTVGRSGPPGLEQIVIDQVLLSETYQAAPSDDGKELRCTANVPNSRQTYRNERRALLKVYYGPLFRCAALVQVSASSAENFTIRCRVKANPVVEPYQILWKVGNTGINLTSGQRVGQFAAKAVLPDVGSDELEVSLAIRNFTEDSYMTYDVWAQNDVTRRRHRITLVEEQRNIRGSQLTRENVYSRAPRPSPASYRLHALVLFGVPALTSGHFAT